MNHINKSIKSNNDFFANKIKKIFKKKIRNKPYLLNIFYLRLKWLLHLELLGNYVIADSIITLKNSANHISAWR